jgi:lactate dehydrogenase-like 2-hydroxyacid dehydrogenase
MFQYHCLNPIAEKGLGLFDEDYKKTEELEGTDAILVRSAKMHDMELPESVKVIARAGAGVNNIPVKDCAEKGIVVFNTPGANANGVKELVLAGMLLASRDIVGGIEWVAKEKDKEDIDKLAEKQKKQFARSWVRNLVSLVLVQSEQWWQTLHLLLEWKYTDMIHISPSMLHGTFPAPSNISRAWMKSIPSVITSPSMYLFLTAQDR